MKKILQIILLFFMLILLAANISAYLEVELQVKESFGLNEKIYFNYTFSSDLDLRVRYIKQLACPFAPFIPSEVEEVDLTDGFYSGSYDYISVYDSLESQTCMAYVRVFDPVEKIVSKNFSIELGTLFPFDILLNKKIYMKGEKIKIDYDSEISNPSIITTLTYPDKTIEQITLPYSFKANQIGTYEIKAIASKEGYKTITKRKQFGVIGADDFDTEPGFFQKITLWFKNLFGINLIKVFKC